MTNDPYEVLLGYYQIPIVAATPRHESGSFIFTDKELTGPPADTFDKK